MLPCNTRKTAAAVQHGGPPPPAPAAPAKIRRASGRRSTRGSSVRRPSACFAKNCAGQRFLRHPVRVLPAGGAGQTAPAASRSFGRHSVGLRHHPAAGAKPPPTRPCQAGQGPPAPAAAHRAAGAFCAVCAVPGAQGPARPVLFVWYAAWCAARLSLIVFLHNYMFARPLLDFGGGFDIIEETKPNVKEYLPCLPLCLF